MENTFLWAQVFGLFAMTISLTAWQIKNPRHVIFCYVPSGTLWGIQYLLLGAPIGVIMSFCSVLKDVGLLILPKKHTFKLIGVFLITIYIISSHFMANWYDILPLIAMTVINLSLLNKDNRSVMARGMLCAQCLWMAYNLIVAAYIGCICCILLSSSIVIGMFRHENWEIGRCYKSFGPSLVRSLFTIPNFKTYP